VDGGAVHVAVPEPAAVATVGWAPCAHAKAWAVLASFGARHVANGGASQSVMSVPSQSHTFRSELLR